MPCVRRLFMWIRHAFPRVHTDRLFLGTAPHIPDPSRKPQPPPKFPVRMGGVPSPLGCCRWSPNSSQPSVVLGAFVVTPAAHPNPLQRNAQWNVQHTHSRGPPRASRYKWQPTSRPVHCPHTSKPKQNAQRSHKGATNQTTLIWPHPFETNQKQIDCCICTASIWRDCLPATTTFCCSSTVSARNLTTNSSRHCFLAFLCQFQRIVWTTHKNDFLLATLAIWHPHRRRLRRLVLILPIVLTTTTAEATMRKQRHRRRPLQRLLERDLPMERRQTEQIWRRHSSRV